MDLLTVFTSFIFSKSIYLLYLRLNLFTVFTSFIFIGFINCIYIFYIYSLDLFIVFTSFIFRGFIYTVSFVFTVYSLLLCLCYSEGPA